MAETETETTTSSSAYKLRGTKQPMSFGVETITGYIVDTTEDSIEGEELAVEDEDGEVVAHYSGYGIKYSRTASVVPLTGTTEPSPGDTITIGTSFSFILKTLKKSRARKDVEKWDMSGSYFENIPLTVIS